jgi:hypothetical protein
MRQIAVTAAVYAVLGVAPSPSSASNPNCWGEPRIYHPAGAYADELETAAAKHVRLRRVRGAVPAEHQLSPNGAYAFHRAEHAHAEGRSGSTTVTVTIFTEADELLEVHASDVWNMTNVKWLNEKLIFFRVWLSRIGGVDLVVDVEQDAIIYKEAVADGRLPWEQAKESCKANPPIPACQERCVGLE